MLYNYAVLDGILPGDLKKTLNSYGLQGFKLIHVQPIQVISPSKIVIGTNDIKLMFTLVFIKVLPYDYENEISGKQIKD